jgi:hypothetical protein
MAVTHVHLLLESCGPFGIVPDGVCNFFSTAGTWFSQSLELVQNPFRWLYHHTLGAPIPQHPGDPGWDACQADWAQPSCPKLIDQLKPANLTLSDRWPRLYGAFSVSGVVLAMTCCAVRVVRGVFDDSLSGMHVVVDNVLRAVVASGVLVAPTAENSVLLNALRLGTAASGHIASAAAATVGSAFGADLDLGRIVGRVAATGFGDGGIGEFLVAIPILLVALAFVYLMSLYLMRIVQLVFAVATAPLFIALAVFDTRNRFLHWWVDLFTSAMILPIVLAICGSLTAGVALFFLGDMHGVLAPGGAAEGVTRTLLACFAVLGGVWMTGKAVHGLAWRSFSHGGLTGAVTAVSTTVMSLPNAASDVAALAGLGGRGGGGRGGGMRHASAGVAIRPAAETGRSGTDRMMAAVGGGPGVAAASPDAEAAIRSATQADFSRFGGVAAVLGQPAMRLAFNAAVGSAIERFAATDVGRDVVVAATAHLGGADVASSDRVADFTASVAADPQLAGAVAGASLASLLHNQPPDLTAILGARSPVPA